MDKNTFIRVNKGYSPLNMCEPPSFHFERLSSLAYVVLLYLSNWLSEPLIRRPAFPCYLNRVEALEGVEHDHDHEDQWKQPGQGYDRAVVRRGRHRGDGSVHRLDQVRTEDHEQQDHEQSGNSSHLALKTTSVNGC